MNWSPPRRPDTPTEAWLRAARRELDQARRPGEQPERLAEFRLAVALLAREVEGLADLDPIADLRQEIDRLDAVLSRHDEQLEMLARHEITVGGVS